MTTGRINQVAADVTSNEFEAGPGSGSREGDPSAVIPKSGEPVIVDRCFRCGAECVLAWVSHLSVPRYTPASGPSNELLV